MSRLLIYPNKLIPKFNMPPAQIADLVAREGSMSLMEERSFPSADLCPHHDDVYLASGGWMYVSPTFWEPIQMAVSRAKRFTFIQNDFTVGLPSQVRRALPVGCEVRAWSTIPDYGDLHEKAAFGRLPKKPDYINWNALTWDLQSLPKGFKHPGIMYYGSVRTERIPYFKQFLKDVPYPVHISCTDRAAAKWDEMGINATLHDPFKSYKDLQAFQATIYLEDPSSHECYMSPANRYYESLSAGIPIFFHGATRSTFHQAGIGISLVDSFSTVDQIVNLLEFSEMTRTAQRLVLTTVDHRAVTLQRLKELLND